MRRWSTELWKSWRKNFLTAHLVQQRVQVPGNHRQRFSGLLTIYKRIMPMSFFARKMAICWGLAVASPVVVFGQTNLVPQGPERPIVSAIGDQISAQAAIYSGGGFLVWEDNSVTTLGSRIKAAHLDSTLSPAGSLIVSSAFKSKLTGDQNNPHVALLNNGGAVVVWQGGKVGSQAIYARFFGANGAAVKSDIRVSTHTKNRQRDPAVATLADGSVIVVWSSDGQDGSMQGVFAQHFSEAGAKLGKEFLVNVVTAFNQRNPDVAALPNGDFVVTWISELERSETSIDVYARIFGPTGVPVTDELPVNTDQDKPCATPSVAASPQGGFAIAWAQSDNARVPMALLPADGVAELTSDIVKSVVLSSNSWDVLGREFDATGNATTSAFVLNTYRTANQYAPKVSALGSDYLAVWTSYGQDGSREGVYGQLFSNAGEFEDSEIQVNTTTIGRQIAPTVASDGASRFLAIWSSFVGGSASFDLFGQTYQRLTP
jgi:hypothetical protein